MEIVATLGFMLLLGTCLYLMFLVSIQMTIEIADNLWGRIRAKRLNRRQR